MSFKLRTLFLSLLPLPSRLSISPALLCSKCECVTHLNGNVSVAETRNGFSFSLFHLPFESYFHCLCYFFGCFNCLLHMCVCARVIIRFYIWHLAFMLLIYAFRSFIFHLLPRLCARDICISRRECVTFSFILHTFELACRMLIIRRVVCRRAEALIELLRIGRSTAG